MSYYRIGNLSVDVSPLVGVVFTATDEDGMEVIVSSMSVSAARELGSFLNGLPDEWDAE